MPSWYEDEYGVCAGRYQASIDRGFREQLQHGWVPPDGWRRPYEPVCRICWYTLVDGDCVNGHASLSGRVPGAAAHAAVNVATPARPESDGLRKQKDAA